MDAAAALLKTDAIRTALVHCWEPLPMRKGPQTLAQRFGQPRLGIHKFVHDFELILSFDEPSFEVQNNINYIVEKGE